MSVSDAVSYYSSVQDDIDGRRLVRTCLSRYSPGAIDDGRVTVHVLFCVGNLLLAQGTDSEAS